MKEVVIEITSKIGSPEEKAKAETLVVEWLEYQLNDLHHHGGLLMDLWDDERKVTVDVKDLVIKILTRDGPTPEVDLDQLRMWL